jgi:hypothetical protein
VRVPEHERPADLLLKTADALAHCWLVDAQPGSGAGEAAGLLNSQESREKFRIVGCHKN